MVTTPEIAIDQVSKQFRSGSLPLENVSLRRPVSGLTPASKVAEHRSALHRPRSGGSAW